MHHYDKCAQITVFQVEIIQVIEEKSDVSLCQVSIISTIVVKLVSHSSRVSVKGMKFHSLAVHCFCLLLDC